MHINELNEAKKKWEMNLKTESDYDRNERKLLKKKKKKYWNFYISKLNDLIKKST